MEYCIAMRINELNYMQQYLRNIILSKKVDTKGYMLYVIPLIKSTHKAC